MPRPHVPHLGIGLAGTSSSSREPRARLPRSRYGIPAPEHVELHRERVTLAARVLPAARLVIVMVSGTATAHVLDILDGDVDMARLPAQAALLPQVPRDARSGRSRPAGYRAARFVTRK